MLALAPGETITEGLDGLRERLAEYRELGARFTKWRAVLDRRRQPERVRHLDQRARAGPVRGVVAGGWAVPIVEPEVLMDGDHPIETSFEVTSRTLHAVFTELRTNASASKGHCSSRIWCSPATPAGSSQAMSESRG